MTLIMAAFTYLNAWWVSLFFAWPFCIEAKADDTAIEAYDYASAPKTIRWKKMMLLTSWVAAGFTAIIALIIHFIKL